MVDRVPTSFFYKRTIDDFARIQKDNSNLSEQVSSGRRASNFTELGSDIPRAIDVEASISSTKRFIAGNDLIISRLKAADVALNQIIKIANEFSREAIIENSPAGTEFNITDSARVSLSEIADALNTQVAGRFIFSGSKTNTQPVADSVSTASNIVNATVTANYYQGDDLTFSIQASKNLELEYGIKANNPAFQKLIAGIHQVIDKEQIGKDFLDPELLDQAIEDIIAVRASINSDIIALEGVNDQHRAVELQLNEVQNNIVGTDVVQTSVKISANQSILTAIFQNFARISSLNLTQFLRT